MPKQHKYTLTENELVTIQAAMKHLDTRVSKLPMQNPLSIGRSLLIDRLYGETLPALP